MNDHPQENLLYMLGEMRADLKYLVSERHMQSQRIDDLETAQQLINTSHGSRIANLEHFKTRIGVITAALGVAVPTGITIVAHKLGLL